jgi:KDO2-lipid IV(A) lauroyltransferase
MKNLVRRTRKSISRISLIWLTKLIQLFARLVPYRIGVLAGGFIGYLAFYLLPRERSRTLTHLTQVFEYRDNTWIRETARRSFIHLGKSLLEVMLMSPERASSIVDIEGLEKLNKALERGRGVVYVTGHIGNWELMASAVASKNYPISVIAAPLEPQQVNDMIVHLREKLGVRTILRSRPGATKELIRVFKENRVLGILIDQDTDVESAFVNFLGRPAWTPTAAASMAIKFDAPVIFGYINRNKRDRHTVTMEGPLDLIQTGNREKDIVDNTAMMTKKIEGCVLNAPEQWVWMHRRWRRQP